MSERVRKILIVEDNPGDLRLIREALRSKGIKSEIEHYETADAGVRVVRSYRADAVNLPEVILLDFNLPAGTAREVLIAIQDNPALANAKKAVLTCSVAPKDREQALAAGADVFVYKPSELDDFLNDVGSAVQTLLGET
ncbi:MAG: response regulator receiver protein [Bryobacterales bacterium]|nr:response regulator receiver protein [Bryobacterales bacterium]